MIFFEFDDKSVMWFTVITEKNSYKKKKCSPYTEVTSNIVLMSSFFVVK